MVNDTVRATPTFDAIYSFAGEEEFRRQLEARQAVFIRQAFTLTKPDQLNGSAS